MKLITYALTALFVLGIELTPENWDEKTEGKTVFLRFWAPWCDYCKEVEPPWLRLMKVFKNSPTVLVGDVDCDGAGIAICTQVGIDGYPTLKYGDPKNPEKLEKYMEGYEYDELLNFVGENIGPICGPKHLNLCEPQQKTKIEGFLALGASKLEEKINELETRIYSIEGEFEKKYSKLYQDYEKDYHEVLRDKENTLKLLRGSDLGLKKIVLADLQASQHYEL